MSSTSVYICGGQTVPQEPDKSLKMPPEAAGKGPTLMEVKEGPNTVINVQSNTVVKEGNQVIGRITTDGKVLSGDERGLRKIMNSKDMEK